MIQPEESDESLRPASLESDIYALGMVILEVICMTLSRSANILTPMIIQGLYGQCALLGLSPERYRYL